MESSIDSVANALFTSGCLKFGSFKIKSGAVSPYYVDLARLLSKPENLCSIAEVAAEHVKEIMLNERINKLASIELKGALIVPSIACRVNLPCVVVRKEEKVYGVTGRIAGADVEKGDSILFFDDVVSEGISKIEGLKPILELGASVRHLLVVVNREQGGKENLEKLGYRVHALATISEVVVSLYHNKVVSKKQSDEVLNYVKTFRVPDTT